MRVLNIVFLAGVGAAVHAQPSQWPTYQYNSNFSPLTQVTPENVSKLTEAWTFRYGGETLKAGALGLDFRFEVQPLLINGVMYVSTPGSQRNPNLKSTISAIEPETGKVLWQYSAPRNIHGRGLTYWPGTRTVGPRLVFATDKGYLMSLDMKTHELAPGFGNKGVVDVYSGVASSRVPPNRRDSFTVPNPVAIYRNLLITGARPGEGSPPQPRGDIRAWDAITGKLAWEFHTIPLPGEPGHEDWTGDSWQDRSGANVWSTMVVDEARGIVFAATGDSNHANTAPGKNLYSNCLLAIDAATGKLKWFHQLVHHDVWDFDMPTPPLLVDVRRDGRTVPAVFLTGKMSYAYVFDRVTGEALHGMEERPVKRSDDPEDQAWPTQPFPVKPGPIARVGMSKADINNMTPEIEKFCTEFWEKNRLEESGPYARQLRRAGLVLFPTSLGGPNWGPLSWNPQLGLVFINIQNSGSYRPAAPLGPGGGVIGAEAGGGGGGGGGQGAGAQLRTDAFSFKLPNGAAVPCYAPPYGAMVAVNVNNGEIAWTSTLGINEAFASLGDAGVKSGTRNMGGSIATAGGLVFIGATNDRRFRAFDAKTGRELWSAELPASAHSTPMTFMGKDGAQYVAVAASGGTAVGAGLPISDALVAYRLAK